MNTTDASNFFQTDSALIQSSRKAAKSSNTAGNPIKLPSKILAIISDPTDDGRLFVAESAGTARRIVLETSEKSQIYRGPAAPVTSLALSPDNTTLLAGCWDNTIWSWDVATRKPAHRFAEGHTDFVKTVCCVRLAAAKSADAGAATFEDVVLSGSADASIVVWRIATGEKLHVLKGQTRGILDLAPDPATLSTSTGALPDAITVFSAGSIGELRKWKISLERAAELDHDSPILLHETSVNRLHFTGEDEDCEIWTASSDKSAKCLVVRSGKWEVDTKLEHPDFVRDVAVDAFSGMVVTACRDEALRVWDKGSGELLHTYEGHFEEVTGVVVVRGVAVSVSIDGTVRRWRLSRADLALAKEEVAKEGLDGAKKEQDKSQSTLTEEEDRELAELMAEDE